MTPVRLIPAVCPRCGADLSLPKDLKKAHCMYCGASVIIGGGGSRAECRICDGYGKLDMCKACGGTGTCIWNRSLESILDSAKVTIISEGKATCDGGKCSACKGTGLIDLRRPCPFCSGLGVCPRCHGTGKCAGCNGVGFIPNPRGSDKCYVCHGEGVVEVERAEIRWGDRCPVCRMALVVDGSFCAYCGRACKCPKCGKEWMGSSDACESCGYKRGTKP